MSWNRGLDASTRLMPAVEPQQSGMAPEWARAMSSMRKIWDDTLEGPQVISRLRDAIVDLKIRTD